MDIHDIHRLRSGMCVFSPENLQHMPFATAANRANLFGQEEIPSKNIPKDSNTSKHTTYSIPLTHTIKKPTS